ncbi:hybrid sensor histidine kinase/response regulator [Nostoc sp. 'Lobaria pulmonaria (5183) cyanobiont']|uniref:hybrid sensor histidine kinase/response regulator n=1 Tax=Nostoc sp. 'Lobaria pulmonaria (5183) cyanobiont' TaxID=1618022 RepID=UPI000CF32FA9|nr:response regulator [Nostoc sp. 'Lobaria pulmonaria (5183) cyanobiont']AVH72796.1 histidine kinase [Nostoc sp. 'Lobaria pulmonaria (5183) cyanobiont']
MNVLRFLLLEDSLLDAELAQAILTEGGIDCELIRVETGADFLAALETEVFDLILADYALPSFDGISALEIARNRTPEVPFIFVSAALGEELAIEALKNGATDYVLKQRLGRLVPSVQRALREAKERRERQQAEESLQKSEAKYRRIVDTSYEGIWMIDSEARTEFVNQRISQMLGYSAEEMLGRSIFDFMDRADDMAAAEAKLEWFKGEESDLKEGRLRCQDGSYIWTLISATAILNEQGECLGAIAMLTDITDRKRTESERDRLLQLEQTARAEAEAANRIKDEFLAVLSHELRSPLNPILGWAKLLQSRKFDEASLNKALKTIERNAKLQAQLIEDLLDVSRILQGKLSLNTIPVDLVSTIEAAMETVHLAAEAKTIEIETMLDPNVGKVLGDAARLQQVFWNLLSNAIKFTETEGKINVRLQHIDAQAQITFSDTGKGIDPDFLPHVFDYFRQSDSTTTRRFGGLGLGLAIARHLIEMHGGTIWAESPGEEQGAIFTVRLPLIKDGATIEDDTNTDSSTAAFPSSPLMGLQVLVVDDNDDTRDFFSFVLEQFGAIVTAVASGDEALQALTQSKPDILLSDIGMPEMNGYMLMQKVRTLEAKIGGKQMPAIALTAYAGEINQQYALRAGFQQHIVKPVAPEELLMVISNLVQST